jgi:hypothetical protein
MTDARLGRYAETTNVPVERSRQEIERVLVKYGAKKFGTMTEPEQVTIYFEIKGREVALHLPMPHDKDPVWRARGETARERETRRRWRVLVITVKAMLEAVESKLLTFDQAFLAHIVIPGSGRTIGDALVPKLDALYSGQSLPALLSENPR